MAVYQLDAENGLYHLHTAPQRADAPTFVFVNALTGSTEHWEAVVAPALREQGFGTLSYNFRGQTDSPFRPGTALTPTLIAADLENQPATRAQPFCCSPDDHSKIVEAIWPGE